MNFRKPVLGFAAFSGTGKTTLLIRLIPFLEQHGVHVALIKHAHHDFDIDKPGKDNYALRKAGARQVLVASDRRSALMTEYAVPRKPKLDDLVAQLALAGRRPDGKETAIRRYVQPASKIAGMRKPLTLLLDL